MGVGSAIFCRYPVVGINDYYCLIKIPVTIVCFAGLVRLQITQLSHLVSWFSVNALLGRTYALTVSCLHAVV